MMKIKYYIKKIIEKHRKERYICTQIETRNRYKNDTYKISEGSNQCVIFNDNRCCGGCLIAKECEHCVNCGCDGLATSNMGGKDIDVYFHKANEHYTDGSRLDKEGNFDWKHYYELKGWKYPEYKN